MADDKSCEGKQSDMSIIDYFHLLDGKNTESSNHKGVDWSNSKDQTVIGIDCSDTIKGLKAIQREAKKATAALKELEEQKESQLFKRDYMYEWVESNDKLITIELESLDSVPVVFYKGEEIKNKSTITLQWKTKTDKHSGRSDILIDYYELNDEGQPTEKNIRESR